MRAFAIIILFVLGFNVINAQDVDVNDNETVVDIENPAFVPMVRCGTMATASNIWR